MTRGGTAARDINHDGSGAAAARRARRHGVRSGTCENSGWPISPIEILTEVVECTATRAGLSGKDSRARVAPSVAIHAHKSERIRPTESARREGCRILFHED